MLLLACLIVVLAICAITMLARPPQMEPVVVPKALQALQAQGDIGLRQKGEGERKIRDLSPSAQFVVCGDEVWTAKGYKGPVPQLKAGEVQRVEREGVLFNAWPEQYIPAHLPPAEPEAHRAHRIPANLFMSFYTCAVQGPYFQAVANTIAKHPNYTYRFFDDVSARRMIAEHMEPEVLEAYDLLIPGAYKCDLWRLCVLYVYGGLYVDMRYGACVNFDTVFDKDTDYFVVNDVQIGHVHNAVMACVPKHAVMRRYIDRVVQMVLARNYGQSALHITGPAILGKVLFEHFPALNQRIPERITHPELGNIKSINFNLHDFTHETHDGRLVGVIKMPGCFNNASFYRNTNKKDYTHLWKIRGVYAEPRAMRYAEHNKVGPK